ncbi:MAG: hypothetical protein IPF56_11585 [Chloroflexi bacterium]|nr:hypothetical protein [Chloroflexota bacterium]
MFSEPASFDLTGSRATGLAVNWFCQAWMSSELLPARRAGEGVTAVNPVCQTTVPESDSSSRRFCAPKTMDFAA